MAGKSKIKAPADLLKATSWFIYDCHLTVTSYGKKIFYKGKKPIHKHAILNILSSLKGLISKYPCNESYLSNIKFD